jgi:cell division protein FtsB
MARSKPVDENGYADGRNAIEAENQKLRDQNYRLRLAIEEAARLIWIKPTEAEKILIESA